MPKREPPTEFTLSWDDFLPRTATLLPATTNIIEPYLHSARGLQGISSSTYTHIDLLHITDDHEPMKDNTRHEEPHLYETIVTDDGYGFTQNYVYASSDNEARMAALASAQEDCDGFDLRSARVYLIDRSSDEV